VARRGRERGAQAEAGEDAHRGYRARPARAEDHRDQVLREERETERGRDAEHRHPVEAPEKERPQPACVVLHEREGGEEDLAHDEGELWKKPASQGVATRQTATPRVASTTFRTRAEAATRSSSPARWMTAAPRPDSCTMP